MSVETKTKDGRVLREFGRHLFDADPGCEPAHPETTFAYVTVVGNRNASGFKQLALDAFERACARLAPPDALDEILVWHLEEHVIHYSGSEPIHTFGFRRYHSRAATGLSKPDGSPLIGGPRPS